MKQSHLFYKTRKEVPSDADSINASYLIRAGFVEKQMAGAYALLPLGLRVIKRIQNIVRQEMDSIGGQELLMNVLQPKEIYSETGRWEKMEEILYKIQTQNGKELALGPTHEEQVVTLAKGVISSYRDLPKAVYQIQTKFRKEARAKSGLLRGREFIMKDMYSFHDGEEDFEKFYELSKKVYLKIFGRFGLEVKIVEASGGVFSEFSHEFQLLTPQGEDEIYYCNKCDFAQNKEIAQFKAGDKCPNCDGEILVSNGIEVGNIFPLSTTFAEQIGCKYITNEGKEQYPVMGCYGLGITRCLGSVVEIMYDNAKNRMVWPKEVAPFDIHIISLNKNDIADSLYERLGPKFEVLYDDRELSAGQKFAEADLVGCPIRLIVSGKSLEAGGIEVIDMSKNSSTIVPIENIEKILNE